jgi:dolichol-phosphate mannosyltransferase
MVSEHSGDSGRLTVVMPAYNEQGAIADAVEEIRAEVLDVVADSGLLVIDDGSRDATGKILDDLAAADQRISVIHQQNAGHGAALRTGLEAASGQWILMLDSDRQIPLKAFAPLWEAAQEGDGAFGIRARRHDPLHRLLLTKIVRLTVNVFFSARLRDANCPFKIIRKENWNNISADVPAGTLAPSIFLAIMLLAQGRRIAQMEVTHLERSTGTVSLKLWRLVKFCHKAFWQLFRFRSAVRRAARKG